MHSPNFIRFQCHSRSSMGVDVDASALWAGLIDLSPYDDGPERSHVDFPSVVINLDPPEGGGYKVGMGLKEEQALFCSNLDSAIANAVWRCAGLLETTMTDLDGLAAEIRAVIDAHEAEKELHTHALGS